MSAAFLYPGQGSQRSGMVKHLFEQFPSVTQPLLNEADEIVDYPLSSVCMDYPDDKLRSTDVAQPAIFLVSFLTDAVLADAGARPDVVAGHSLGEYTALVAAGVLAWQDALALVQRRGELMAQVSQKTAGGMAAVLNVGEATVSAWCQQAAEETSQVVELANDNGEWQQVIAGQDGALARFGEIFADAALEDSSLVPLKVSAPFHCSLMSPVEEELGRAMDAVTFSDPVRPVVANVTAAPVATGEEAKQALRRQVAGTVRWRETLALLGREGHDPLVEVGPGKVLAGLTRRALPEATALSTQDTRFLRRTLSTLV